MPLKGTTAYLLAPGVGCPNACRFCSTSHFFGQAYLPFIRTGQELFDVAGRISDQTGTDSFFVMDENFLKQKPRALDMLQLMEKHRRWFRFYLFSSADTLLNFGIENMVRLGVNLVCIGLESKTGSAFDKNTGIDFQGLVRDLRDHGIGVLVSGIVCMEHHTPASLQEDIDALISLQPDMIQFMLLTGLPLTRLYEAFKQSGQLRRELPFEEWHGQKQLNFTHPHFSGDEPETWLQFAFDQDYIRNGSSICRLIETSLRGVQTLQKLAEGSEVLSLRRQQLLEQIREYRPLLLFISRYAVNDEEKQKVHELDQAITELLGSRTVKDVALSALIRKFGDVFSNSPTEPRRWALNL